MSGFSYLVLADVDMGPVGVWVGAMATFFVGITALLVAAGTFERFRGPRLHISFDQAEPWCRAVAEPGSDGAGDQRVGEVFWVRVAVENSGKSTARGCVGRLTGVRSDGVVRADIDPIQLAWAGVPRSRAFQPVDVRPGQREFLNVLFLADRSHWTIDTFGDDDFYPGFSTRLPADARHVITVALFADNVATLTGVLEVVAPSEQDVSLRLLAVSRQTVPKPVKR